MSNNGVIEIFRRVLESDTVTASSNFFELGGDSLLATRVIGAIYKQYAVELSLDELYSSPSPEALSAQIQRIAA